MNERAFRSSINWQKIRARQLARAPMCAGCETAPAVEVDHIVPIGQGGAARDPANLQSLCRQCHTGKTAAEREGKRWTPARYRGCHADGSPRDPAHPWHGGALGERDARPAWRDRRRA